jgi:hypothetical protein
MNKHIFCASIRILGETHFPKHFAVKTRYFLSFEGRDYVLTFWTYFLDGHESAIILN